MFEPLFHLLVVFPGLPPLKPLNFFPPPFQGPAVFFFRSRKYPQRSPPQKPPFQHPVTRRVVQNCGIFFENGPPLIFPSFARIHCNSVAGLPKLIFPLFWSPNRFFFYSATIFHNSVSTPGFSGRRFAPPDLFSTGFPGITTIRQRRSMRF